MSGGIKIAEKNYWGAAGWAYYVVRNEIIDVLVKTGRCPSLLAYLRDPTDAPNVLEYVDLESRSPEEFVAFREAAGLALEQIRKRGEDDWNHVSTLSDFLNHYQDLLRRLDSRAENPRPTEPPPRSRGLLPPPENVTLADVQRLVRAGEYLSAIHWYRAVFPGTGLAEAQKAINDLGTSS